MCGITGIYCFKEGLKIEASIIKKMTDVLSHRGPDDDGYYLEEGIALGQRRLSIIDLEGGKQPVHNEDSSIWVIYNGEIFNYIELSEELQKKGIGTVTYYVNPVHQMPYYRETYGDRKLPETEKAARQVFSLPIHPGVTELQVDYIGKTLLELL